MSFQDFMMKIAGDESLFVAFLVVSNNANVW